MEVRGTATIGITTPQDKYNFFSELLELRDERGRLVFNSVRVGQSCKACQRAGRENSCTHPAPNLPPWKTIEARSKVKAIYGARKALFEREILGMIANDENAAFKQVVLDRWFKAPPLHDPHAAVETVYMCLDPNGGRSNEIAGDGSAAAIVSLFYQGGNMVVVGIDAHMAKDHEEMWTMCHAHARALRLVPCLVNARIVFIPEVNMGAEGRLMSQRMIELPNTQVACQKPTDYGVKTTTGSHDVYMLRLLNRLQYNAVAYHHPLVAANPFLRRNGGTTMTAADVVTTTRKEFEAQLGRFSIHFKPPKTLSNAQPSLIYSGKFDRHGRHSSRMRDDMVLALLMACYWSGQIIEGLMTLRDYTSKLMQPDM